MDVLLFGFSFFLIAGLIVGGITRKNWIASLIYTISFALYGVYTLRERMFIAASIMLLAACVFLAGAYLTHPTQLSRIKEGQLKIPKAVLWIVFDAKSRQQVNLAHAEWHQATLRRVRDTLLLASIGFAAVVFLLFILMAIRMVGTGSAEGVLAIGPLTLMSFRDLNHNSFEFYFHSGLWAVLAVSLLISATVIPKTKFHIR